MPPGTPSIPDLAAVAAFMADDWVTVFENRTAARLAEEAGRAASAQTADFPVRCGAETLSFTDGLPAVADPAMLAAAEAAFNDLP